MSGTENTPPELLSEDEVFQLRLSLIHRKAEPREVRTLLQQICFKLRSGGLNDEELRFLDTALVRFLSANMSLDQAFGLAKTRGAPPGQKDEAHEKMASEMLALMMQGESYENAAALVEEALSATDGKSKRGSSEVTAKRAWSNFKHAALSRLQVERYLSKNPWTDEEEEALRGIFKEQFD